MKEHRLRIQVSPLRRRARRARFFFCSNRETAIEAETPSLREQDRTFLMVMAPIMSLVLKGRKPFYLAVSPR